jgi:hypothetical protein
MNRFDINSNDNKGGHPVQMQDFKSLSDGLVDVASMAGAMASPTFEATIIGTLHIEDNGTTFNLSQPSVAWFNSTPWRIITTSNAAKSTAPNAAFKLKKHKVLANGDPVMYENAQQKEVHYDEYFSIEHTDTIGPDYVPLDVFNNATWIALDAITGIVTLPNTAVQLRYKAVGCTLYLWISVPSGASAFQANNAYIQLPSIYKARETSNFVVQGGLIAGNPPASVCLKIAAGDNKLYVTDFDGSTGNVVGGIEITPTVLVLEVMF